MAGRPQMPLSVIMGGGNKSHLTKEEIEKRKKAETRLKPKADKVSCPSWLDGVARAEWQRIIGDLKELELVSNLDLTALAMYCDAYSKYRVASELVRKEGPVIEFRNATGAVNQVKHPAVEVMKTMAGIAKSYGAEFGLSFGARARLVPGPEEESKETELEKNGFGDV